MTVAILDARAGESIISALAAEGFETASLPACKRLPSATESHPDMLAVRLGDTILTEKKYREETPAVFDILSAHLPRIMWRTADILLGESYPEDCRLNALLMGDRLFVKSDTAAPELLELARERKIRIVTAKQGYPACTVLSLGDSHAITADRGMAKLLRSEGIEVLLIKDGGILLPPYEYGFIGGASGVYKNKVYFLGDVSSHPSGEEIIAFCRSAGYEPISLCAGPLRDLGRIIFIDT